MRSYRDGAYESCEAGDSCCVGVPSKRRGRLSAWEETVWEELLRDDGVGAPLALTAVEGEEEVGY